MKFWQFSKRIYQYSNYREFIKDFVEQYKNSNPSLSYRSLSDKAGINSSGFYSLIVQGQRNLTHSTAEKTCNALGLEEAETHYFTTLVKFNQSKSLNSKNQLFKKLIELQKKSSVATIKESKYEIFSQWFHPVVREIVTTQKFFGDYRKLGRMVKPEITSKEARSSVNLLMRLGFLKKEKGKYSQNEPILKAGQDINSHQIMNYQVQMLKLAIDAYNRFGPNDLLSNLSTTVHISEKSYLQFKEKLRDCQNELLQLANLDDNPEQVYQVNMNLFPLTNIKTKKGEDE